MKFLTLVRLRLTRKCCIIDDASLNPESDTFFSAMTCLLSHIIKKTVFYMLRGVADERMSDTADSPLKFCAIRT